MPAVRNNCFDIPNNKFIMLDPLANTTLTDRMTVTAGSDKESVVDEYSRTPHHN